jgi:hypothetical protein
MRPGNCGVLRPNQDRAEPRRGLTSRLREQFRSAVTALTGTVANLTTRRRHKNGGGRGFGAASMILRRAVRLLPMPAINPHWNAFTWLHLWEYNHATETNLYTQHQEQQFGQYLNL